MARSAVQITDYNRAIWDRLEGVAAPGEHLALFGHDNALATIDTAFNSGKMHHAWLISGPRGIGKASLALKVAANILRNPIPMSGQKWNDVGIEDAVFSKVAKGGHPNILHLSRPCDGKTKKFKSTLTVDEIRRTVSFFGTTAGEDSWRFCIVDSADDMNTSAANSLLKILEEPPQRTIFFVLANSPAKLLSTIRSRCRQLPLRPLNNDDLISALSALDIDLSNMNEDERVVLARLSAGSVRRAIILLEQQGLELYQKFDRILGNGNAPDWPQAHQLADELSRKNKLEQFHLLFDIARDYISNTIHLSAAKNSPKQSSDAHKDLSGLARLCEVWEKVADSAALADEYNLDKKQVILNLFGSLAQAR